MARYLIQLAYKGTNFNGWQRQTHGKAITIQGSLEHSLSLILREKIQITGAGRTDTGVHASFYVAHFDTKQNIDTQKITHKLNSFVSKDITIIKIHRVPDNFHARYSALSRTYKYFIHTRPNPFLQEFSHYVYYPLDVDKMKQATRILSNYQDFKAFSKAHSGTKHYLVELHKAQWTQENDKLIFTISANRFLRNMVRAIVGTMLEIGRGKLSIDQMEKLIQARSRHLSTFTAPANGLFLIDIKYPQEIEDILDKEIKFFYDDHI